MVEATRTRLASAAHSPRLHLRHDPHSREEYQDNLHAWRHDQYPMLKEALYLDHAGTTLYAKSLIDRFSADMLANLYGNPHSASPSSLLSTTRIDDVRHASLLFLGLDPSLFDLVFVANATAGAKLVAEAFQARSFHYAYHKDSHTSLIGLRELAAEGTCCLASDEDVERWLDGEAERPARCTNLLFSYPAQSNMDGRRLPLAWAGRLRASHGTTTAYTLLDAAALLSTSPLRFETSEAAPDFITLSFYKIFGFPDLGALIVRKSSAHVFRQRAYFGGGTVEMVSSVNEEWHERKGSSTHAMLEDGTLPIHSIMALRSAIDTHTQLFGTMSRISHHVSRLSRRLHRLLSALQHANGRPLCIVYNSRDPKYGQPQHQGPIVAFNMKTSTGAWISNTEVEKIASIKNIHLRAGGVCNPGGVATALGLEPWEMRRNFAAGHRCGTENDVVAGKPTGILRVSLGAMSTQGDVDRFIEFLTDFFLDKTPAPPRASHPATTNDAFFVDTLTIYPIKSCAGWDIPRGERWPVYAEGLALDRAWCITHLGTGAALTMKRHPRMALVRPSVDVAAGLLRITYAGTPTAPLPADSLAVPLADDPPPNPDTHPASPLASTTVCGDTVLTRSYADPTIAAFLSAALGLPCTLARLPAPTPGARPQRHAKPLPLTPTHPHPTPSPGPLPQPLLLSNESPILLITHPSLTALNTHITTRGHRPSRAAVFRANIVVAARGPAVAYAEDAWTGVAVGGARYDALGPCRRCAMVCVDDVTARRGEEPFVSLARTRRREGRVWFGVHLGLRGGVAGGEGRVTIGVGDEIVASRAEAGAEMVDGAGADGDNGKADE